MRDLTWRPALIAVGVNGCFLAIPQISTIASVVPDSRITAVIEATPLWVIFIRVNFADLPWLYDEVGECEHVVIFVAQCPAIQLDRLSIVVANVNVFIGFLVFCPVIEDVCDDNVPCGLR
jgi:hypothetical protein